MQKPKLLSLIWLLKSKFLNKFLKGIKIGLILLSIFIVIYSVLIFFDYEGPTAVYDRKLIGIHGNFMGQPGGFYTISLEYRSKGVISSNKDIEFFIYNVQYGIQKEQFKDIVGKRNIWDDNITVEICPDTARASGDLERQKNSLYKCDTREVI